MRSVLYIEDNADARLILKHIFPIDDLKIICYPDSHNIIKRIQQLHHIPVLIILDIHVEPLTGFDILKELKQESAFSAIPVVALTASVTNDEVKELRRSGFDGAMSKPINVPDFPEFVRRTIAGESIWLIS